MGPNRTFRILAAIAAGLLGLLGATTLGAPLLGAVIALSGGAIAIAIAAGGTEHRIIEEAPVESGGPPLPGAGDLLAAIDDPMLIVRDRRVLIANAAAREVLGEHIEGVDVRLAIRHPAAAERLASTIESEQGVFRTELVGIGERERRWEMATSRLHDASWLVRLTDRSEVHASEKMRGDFVANASHELRTPLATLLGFLETLQDEQAAADPKTRKRFINIMFDEAKRMHRLVDDLISLSRIEAERFTLPHQIVDLLPLVEEVRQSCARMAEKKHSALIVESGDAAPVVLGDPSQLLQLMQNLVVNALKYGRKETPVTIRFEISGPDMLKMSIVDQGEGILPEHIPRLTERFYRVDPGRSRAVGGTGLGLAIVKHIVSRHRGRLDIDSIVGQGTTVHVFLPRPPETLS